MLYFVSRDLALGYLLFAFLASLGALQWVARNQRLAGLGLFDYSRRPRCAAVLGFAFIAGGLVWFMTTQWEGIFAPGPAGTEISLLFGVGAVAAVLVSMLGAAIRPAWRRENVAAPSPSDYRLLEMGHVKAHLYLPSAAGAVPVVCLVPTPGVSSAYRSRMARRLTQVGVAALIVGPDYASYAYPDILALVPAASAIIREQPELDSKRIGVLGFDLGGDLAIRVAGADKQVRAAVALAPVWTDAPVSLDLLTEMPFTQAWRWGYDRSRARLRRELDAQGYAARIPPRPLLVLYGAEDRLVVPAPASVIEQLPGGSGSIQTVEGLGHFDLASSPTCARVVSAWFKAHL